MSEVLATFADRDAQVRRWRNVEALVLASAALAVTLVFGFTKLDLLAMEPFYHPGAEDPWPLAHLLAFRALYASAPWITASLALAGTGFLVAGLARKGSRRMRLFGLFIVLSVALGPGLLVNAVFKDTWGRPRPRQVRVLGGDYPFVPPLLRAATAGKSFPCGHCSVAYLYALGWWILRRKRPGLGRLSLAAGLLLGTLLGVGRMAAGAHFPSDVLWSALISYGVAHVLYFHVLHIPAHENRGHPALSLLVGNPRRRALSVAAALVVGLGIVAGGILASPHFLDLSGRRSLEEGPSHPQVLQFLLDRTDLEIQFVDEPGMELVSHGWINGFGLPTNELEAGWTQAGGPEPVLTYSLAERGWFTEVEGILRIVVPAQAFHRVVVRLQAGNVRVRGPASGPPLPEMDILSGNGRVELPPPSPPTP